MQVILKLTDMWKYVKKDGRPQINSDNIKYYIED
jgi:hypothetical protein